MPLSGKRKTAIMQEYPIYTNRKSEEKILYILCGPTCDAQQDQIARMILPKMDMGDLVIFGCAGAYTLTQATDFNSPGKTPVILF